MATYKLSDTSPEIRVIRAFLRRKFASYAGQLADTDVFDQSLADVVSEVQRRYNIPVTGQLDYGTQIRMGYAQKIVLFTVNGFMGDMWQQMPAETARHLEDLFEFQPVGYQSGAFPLGVGRDDGERELRRLLNDLYPNRKFALAGYSLGAVITADVYDAIRNGDLKHRNTDLIGCVAWGSPRRPAHRWTGMTRDPGGQGIAGPDNLRNPDARWVDYVYEPTTGDIYTNAPIGGAGDDMTLIYNLVLTKWDGSIASILAEAIELLSRPIDAVVSIATACINGIVFAVNQQRPHQLYPIDDAVTFLRGAAQQGGTDMATTTGGFTWNKALGAGVASFLLSTFVPALLGLLHVVGPVAGAVNPGLGGIVGVLTAILTWLTPKNATKTS